MSKETDIVHEGHEGGESHGLESPPTELQHEEKSRNRRERKVRKENGKAAKVRRRSRKDIFTFFALSAPFAIQVSVSSPVVQFVSVFLRDLGVLRGENSFLLFFLRGPSCPSWRGCFFLLADLEEWIPASAGMTRRGAGMTKEEGLGMTGRESRTRVAGDIWGRREVGLWEKSL